MCSRSVSRLRSLSAHIVRAPLLNMAASRHISSSMSHKNEHAQHTLGFIPSPVPPNPFGEGGYIRTAGALIIGDEILNGKTKDSNSNYFARYCFEKGIDLKRVEIIADDEDEIIQASRRMVKDYDFVITTGGIGPTHDDITYVSLAKSFSQPLVHHPETLSRMRRAFQHRRWLQDVEISDEQREATHRMALFPENAEVLFVATEMWVPVVRLEGKLCVFPGIPRLFQALLDGLTPFLPLPPPSRRPKRLQVFTPQPESLIAPYLSALQSRVKEDGIQIGSYPVMQKGVCVSLIGRDAALLDGLAAEVIGEIEGRLVSDREVESAKSEGTGLRGSAGPGKL